MSVQFRNKQFFLPRSLRLLASSASFRTVANQNPTHNIIAHQTVFVRNARDYLRIMVRSPSIPREDHRKIIDFVQSQGYDVGKIRKVPHES